MNKKIQPKIQTLFKTFNPEKILKITPIKQSGSYRKYYRITTEKQTILGVYNPDKNENKAYIEFSKHFLSKKHNVPKIIAEFNHENIYFVQDLGNTTLFDYLQTQPQEKQIIETYKKIIDNLIKLQFNAIKNLNLKNAYPRPEFDKQAVMWDLNYYKYCVLKTSKVQFNEQKLENDFNKLTKNITSEKNNCFMFRDFQSKNIMLFNNKIYFIDFQGGRKGPPFYDFASLIYDTKAKLTTKIKIELIKYHYKIIKQKISINKTEYLNLLQQFQLIRTLQALGAYSLRGIIEHKLHFIKSIPPALENVEKILTNNKNLTKYPELKNTLHQLVNNSKLTEMFTPTPTIQIQINSFSYKYSGYPTDTKGNGGGFVFDCRLLPNPGKIEQYKKLSGLDKKVKKYLNTKPQVETFIVKTIEIITDTAKKYQQIGYKNLQINFGCTGGQHRSVYCAQKTAEILSKLFNIKTNINHIQLKKISKI